MDARVEQIVRGLERLLRGVESSFIATVTSVGSQTVDVQDMNSTDYLNVRLSATEGKQGFVVVPKVWSFVIVSRLSNSDSLFVSMVSEVDSVVIMEGENGGLVRVSDLVTRLNNIEDDINTLKNVFATWTTAPGDGGGALRLAAATWYGSQLVKTLNSDIENTKVKH